MNFQFSATPNHLFKIHHMSFNSLLRKTLESLVSLILPSDLLVVHNSFLHVHQFSVVGKGPFLDTIIMNYVLNLTTFYH